LEILEGQKDAKKKRKNKRKMKKKQIEHSFIDEVIDCQDD
jgi:hypothetical protein